MSIKSEWEVGSEIGGKEIYIRLKGIIDSKFSHSFLTIEDADELAKHIKYATSRLKEASVGVCTQCKEIITNEEPYYELSSKKLLHKKCIGDYLESNIITEKLTPKFADKVDTRAIKYENKLSNK